MSRDAELGIVTHNDLRAYDGSPRVPFVPALPRNLFTSWMLSPICISVNGIVLDVTSSARIYGKGGMYAVYGGNEVANSLGSGVFTKDALHEDEALPTDQEESLLNWRCFLLRKYKAIGYVEGSSAYNVLHDIQTDAPVGLQRWNALHGVHANTVGELASAIVEICVENGWGD